MAGGEGASFLETPSYVLGVVFLVFLIIQIVFEKVLHGIKHHLEHHGMHGLLAAVNSTVMELSLMAFFSLLILISESLVEHICVPYYSDYFDILHPMLDTCADCLKDTRTVTYPGECKENSTLTSDYDPKRLLLGYTPGYEEETMSLGCGHKREPFISVAALHQIHIFLFLLAVTHIATASIIIMLGYQRMKHWRWVSHCDTLDDIVHGHVQQYHESVHLVGSHHMSDQAQDQESKTFTRMPSSVVLNEKRVQKMKTREETCMGRVLYKIKLWLKLFFSQFYKTINSHEFLLMRSNFIFTHKLGRNFQFTEYLMRVMEYDFASMTEIGVQLWILLIIMVVVSGPIGWVGFAALIAGVVIILIVNTMLLRVLEQVVHTGIITHLYRIECKFWFNRPWLLLALVRFAIFLNTIGFASTAFFAWQFGPKSCYFTSNNFSFIGVPWYVCLIFDVLLMLDIGMVTLPLYSATAQMNGGERWQAHLLPGSVTEKLTEVLHKIRERNKASRSRPGMSVIWSRKSTAHPESMSRHDQLEEALISSSGLSHKQNNIDENNNA
eukprot:TRINITY_DN7210_c0_g1_i10.p1 TRINITY_DN7210_c0_g1~~TRINITY_DN7210_c0_g1_i10.p1  ORF type:complete len:553 (+),score=26.64 TRINITY_DN7210_c0_g1_i10:207-1865(+)